MPLIANSTEKSFQNLANMIGIEITKGWKKRLAESFGFNLGNISTWISRDRIPNAIVVKIEDKGYPSSKWLYGGVKSPRGEAIRPRQGVPYAQPDQEMLARRQTFREGESERSELDGFQVIKLIEKEGDIQRPRLVGQLTEILESGDEIVIRALVANLEAFYRSIQRDKGQVERIQKLEDECDILKKRVDSLEEKLEAGSQSPIDEESREDTGT